MIYFTYSFTWEFMENSFFIKSLSSELTYCFYLSSIASGSFGFRFFKASTSFFPWSLTVFVYFLKTFPKGEKVCLVCFVICSWLEGNISSTVRYLYLSILPDDKADILKPLY